MVADDFTRSANYENSYYGTGNLKIHFLLLDKSKKTNEYIHIEYF